MTNVKGKWALITGASRGIGEQIARFMAKQGCNLILHSRNLQHSEQILNEVKSLGAEAFAVGADLADTEQVKSMLEEIDSKNIPVDIVFNNAAVQIGYRVEYFNTPVADFTESFKINTIAPALITYHFMQKMTRRGFGRIINVTSGIRLEPEQAGYSASKAALDKFTIDLGSKVNKTDVMINLADPGWCRTDLGGPHAPNSVESVIPGIIVGAFVDDKKSGRNYGAQTFAGMSLEEAVKHAETFNSPY